MILLIYLLYLFILIIIIIIVIYSYYLFIYLFFLFFDLVTTRFSIKRSKLRFEITLFRSQGWLFSIYTL